MTHVYNELCITPKPRRTARGRLVVLLLLGAGISGCTDRTAELEGKWYIKRIEYENGRKALDTDSNCYFIDFQPLDQVSMHGLTVTDGVWKSRDDKIYLQTEKKDTMDILILSSDSLVVRFFGQQTFMRYVMSRDQGQPCQ